MLIKSSKTLLAPNISYSTNSLLRHFCRNAAKHYSKFFAIITVVDSTFLLPFDFFTILENLVNLPRDG